MNERGMPREEVIALLERYRRMDHRFGDGTIFGSMCTTPHPLAMEAHSMFIESNLGNRGLYPGTSRMEDEVVSDVGRLLGLPHPNGQVLSGGTEANILALWSARESTEGWKVLLPRHAHFSFKKACRMLRLEPVEVPSREYVMDPSALKDLLDDDTACVVAVAGITETGLCDPIDEIGNALEGTGIPFHVDAAFGGFVLPFLDDPPVFDFRVPQLRSMTVDPHKMGMGTIPGGILLYRDRTFLDGIRSHAPYLTQKTHYSITGTKGSAGVASAFSAVKSLGREGYRELVSRCMTLSRYLCRRADDMGFPCAFEPLTNVVVLSVKNPERVYEALREKGLYVSTCREPPGLRIVLMPHITEPQIDNLLGVLRGVVE